MIHEIGPRWINVTPADQKELGSYSFMAMLEASGKISFFYLTVPELTLFVVDEGPML
jgi:hypothetical protein